MLNEPFFVIPWLLVFKAWGVLDAEEQEVILS